MRKITLRQAQLLELDILLEFARFCEEAGLTYWIAYGTLLGAVRHKGFIPWDDDVDVLMPRADYDKMIRLFPSGNRVPHYRLIAPMDERSRHSFVKIIDTRTVKLESNFDYAPGTLGIDIDVFPLDGQPEDDQTFRRWYGKLKQHYYRADFPVRLTHECRRKNLLLGLINRLGGKRHLLGVQIKRHYQKKARKLHARYPYGSTKMIGMVEHCFDTQRERFPADRYRETILLEFEGHLFRAPKEYDAVLRQAYGNYMRLPPEAERRGHLIDHAYWKA